MDPIQLSLDADTDIDSRRPPIVLMHGFSLDGEIWDPTRDGIREIGATASVELLGHGKSPDPNDPVAYTLPAYLEHCQDVLDRLGLSSAWWLGYSMGGWIVLHLALERPRLVEGLVLLSTTAGIEDETARNSRRLDGMALAEGTERHGMDWFFEHYTLRYPSVRELPSDQLAALRALRTRNSPIGTANALRGAGLGVIEPMWNRLPDIAVPVLVICGEEDPGFSDDAPRMAGLLPRSRLEMIPNVGHPVVRERPAELVAALKRFFSDMP